MKRFALLLILLALLVSPVIAAEINTTVIDVYTAPLQGTHYYSLSGLSIIAPSSTPIILGHMIRVSEGSTATIILTQNSGNTIQLITTATPVGAFAGVVATNINGGISTVIGYPRFGVNPFSFTVPYIETAYVVDSNGNFYLVSDSDSDLLAMEYPASVGAFYIINTTTTSYIPIDSPATNPIRSISYSATASGTVVVGFRTHEETVAAIANAKQYRIYQEQQKAWYEQLAILLWMIITAAYNLIALGITLSIYVVTGAAFLFGAQVFLTLNVAYLIIAAVLSVHDSDNIFVAVGRFYRRMKNLMDFYYDVFKFAKKILIWWS